MKNIFKSNTSKEVIKDYGINKESIYYVCLFGAASITALVLLIIAYAQRNSGLKIYSWILLPVFILSTVMAARYAYTFKDKIYVADDALFVKCFLATKRYEIDKIERLTAATNNTDGITSINVCYENTVTNYKLTSMSKEEIAHLRRATSKY